MTADELDAVAASIEDMRLRYLVACVKRDTYLQVLAKPVRLDETTTEGQRERSRLRREVRGIERAMAELVCEAQRLEAAALAAGGQ